MSDECMCRFDEEDGDCLLYYHCPEGYRLLNAGDRSRFAQHIVTAVRRLDAEQRAKGVPSDDEIKQAWQSWSGTFTGSVLDWVIFMAGAKWGHSRGAPAVGPVLGTCEEEFNTWATDHGCELYLDRVRAQAGFEACWNLHHPPEPDPCDVAWREYRSQVLRGGDIPAVNAEAAFRAGWEKSHEN